MTLTSIDKNQTPPPRDAWHEAFLVARDLQDSHGWEDFLLPVDKATKAITILSSQSTAPFMVLNGITGGDGVWLWLSPAACSVLCHEDEDLILDSVKIQRGYYMSIRKDKGGPVQEALRLLNLDADASIRRHINSREQAA